MAPPSNCEVGEGLGGVLPVLAVLAVLAVGEDKDVLVGVREGVVGIV